MAYLFLVDSEEVELCLKGNKVFHPGTENDTIGSTYEQYMKEELASYYNSDDGKISGKNNKCKMVLELFVDKIAVSLTDIVFKDVCLFDSKFLEHCNEVSLRFHSNVALSVLSQKCSGTMTSIAPVGKQRATLPSGSKY